MKAPHLPGSGLDRRRFLLLATASLGGCGGGGETAALPGTGGTGIYAQGAIAGFGSVIVRGVAYDDSNAASAGQILLDGVASASSELRLGMVATVQGAINPDAITGTAERIEVWSVAQGTISRLGSNEITVSGNIVQTDASTVFDGIGSFSALAPGDRITVWGLQNGADGVRWSATRIALTNNTAIVSSGVVNQHGDEKTLNGWNLSGAAATTVAAGQLVRVQGSAASASSRLTVTSARNLGSGSAGALAGEAKLEGFVTASAGAGKLMLGNVEVDASRAATLPTGASVTVGSRVEIKGRWLSGVLKATEIELQDEVKRRTVSIYARIEKYSSLSSFTIRAQECDASQAEIKDGTAADVKVGAKVKITGTNTGGSVLKVSKLELK